MLAKHLFHTNQTLYQLLPYLLLSTGLCLYTISLFITAFYTSAESIIGIWVLITGWAGIVFFQFAWYANIIQLLAFLIFQQQPKVAILLSLLALTLASGTFMLSEIPIGINQEKIHIRELGLGFYIWYLAQFVFLLSMLSHHFIVRRGLTNPSSKQ